MADTIRSRSQLVTALADNTTHLITAQTIRDLLISIPVSTDDFFKIAASADKPITLTNDAGILVITSPNDDDQESPAGLTVGEITATNISVGDDDGRASIGYDFEAGVTIDRTVIVGGSVDADTYTGDGSLLTGITQSQIANLTSDLAAKALASDLTTHTALTTTAHGGIVPSSRTISTTAPITITGGGDLSANRTIAISAASGSAAGSMSAADFTKLAGIATGATANTGTVTQVGLSLPGEFTISNSPVTGTGTLTGTWQTQLTGKAFMSPNGSTGTPSFRSIVANDLPTTQNATTFSGAITGSKRITSGVVTVTPSSNTYTPNIDNGNTFDLTLGAVNTVAAPTGTVADGHSITLRIKQDGTGGRTITWNAIYRWTGGSAPTFPTTLSKTVYVVCKYNSAASKWDSFLMTGEF